MSAVDTGSEVRRSYELVGALSDRSVVVSKVHEDVVAAYEAQLVDVPIDAPLRGMAALVKDNIAVAGLPTAAGCPAFADGPAPASAAAVERLVAGGACVLGTTNMDQFATGLVGTRSPHGVPVNPVAPGYIPGGSSSGSAVAVARGLVRFALGTDTAGSGRVPASCTNTVGLKPTRGTVSTRGVVPAVAGIDCVSVQALTVAEAFAVYTAIAGYDAADPWSRPAPRTRGPGRGCPVVGWLGDAEITSSCEAGVAQAYAATRTLVAERLTGTHGPEVDLSHAFAAGALLYGPLVAARTDAVGAFVRDHPNEVDPVVAAVIGAGFDVLGTDVFAAQRALAQFGRAVDDLFAAVDVFVVPTIPFLPTIEAVAADPIGVNARLARYTDFVNVCDLCAVAVPGVPRADGLPFGITVIGAAGSDALVADVAARVHAAVGGRLGATTRVVPDDPWPTGAPALGGPERLVVAGAHLRGLPLHHELTALGARLVASTSTAPRYRLYALAGTEPPKPGLVRADDGKAIDVEVYALGTAELGRFVAGVRFPLAIGPIDLADGTTAPGFLATENTLDGALDITHFGGWRSYIDDGRST